MNKSKINIITIQGTSYQRGKQHGVQLKKKIAEICSMHQKSAKEGGIDYKGYIEEIMKTSQFYNNALKYCPSLIEEVKGIADGADRKFDEIFFLQNFEENGWIFLKKLQKQSTSVFTEGQGLNCSALGTCQTQNGYPLIGQNADNSVSLVGYETLIHALDTESDLEWYTNTFPGLLGIYGLNNHGIGLCINSFSLSHTKSLGGLGSAFIAREILNCRTLKEAIKFLKKVPHASGLNYLIGDSRNICCVETSPADVKVIQPIEGSIFHTNHAFELQDLDHDYLNFYKTTFQLTDDDIDKLELDTTSRLLTLKTDFKKIDGFKTWKDLKQMLSSHTPPEMPVCRHGPPQQQFITNSSFVMELSNKPTLRICAGPPCKSQYQEFTFETNYDLK